MQNPNPRPPIMTLKDEIQRYITEHGFKVADPESLRLNQKIPQVKFNPQTKSLVDISISEVARQEYMSDETGQKLPKMYDDLVDFVKQGPPVQQIQLKPLLFAFFYYTVVFLYKKNKNDLAREFFEKYTKHAEPGMEFHSFQQTDIKKLYAAISSTSFSRSAIETAIFHTSLTETTYQSLVIFLMDKSYTQFLNILNMYVKVTFVPFNFFANRMDMPNFLYHSTDQSEDTAQTQTNLLANSPIDLACKFLGENCDFKIIDDPNPSTHSMNPFELPSISHSRVVEIASDLESLQKLSKNSLPSVAYFTFHNENISYDINYNGTLLAAATPYGYTQLFATSVVTDIDSNLVVFKQQDKLDLVPRIRTDQNIINKYLFTPNKVVRREIYHHSYFNRTLIGPRTYCCRFSPESRLILCAGSSVMRLWSCEHNSGFSQINAPSGIIWCVDWSPFSHHFVCGTDDKCSWLWAVDRKSPIRFFLGHQEAITDIKYHPNASTIATASYDRSVMLWDIRENKKSPCTKVFADESSSVPMSVQFSRNGRVVVSADENGMITTTDIGEGRKIGSVQAHKGEIRDLAISIEGTILASAGPNGEVCLWDMATLCSSSASNTKPLKKLTPRNSNTNRLSFSSRNLLHAIGSLKQ